MPAISESAGWGPASWWPRSKFAGSKDINKFPSFSENWKRWFRPRRRLSNAGRRRRVSYARAATFHGKSGDPKRTDKISLFQNLRVVIVDEIHAFAGDDRGWHVLALLERLTKIAGR